MWDKFVVSTTAGGGYLCLVYDAGAGEPVTASFFLAERSWDYDLQAFDGIIVQLAGIS